MREDEHDETHDDDDDDDDDGDADDNNAQVTFLAATVHSHA